MFERLALGRAVKLTLQKFSDHLSQYVALHVKCSLRAKFGERLSRETPATDKRGDEGQASSVQVMRWPVLRCVPR